MRNIRSTYDHVMSKCYFPVSYIMDLSDDVMDVANRCIRITFVKADLYDKIFLSHLINFSFDSFLSTLNACIQLRNVNEIFQSTIMKVFQKKNILPDF